MGKTLNSDRVAKDLCGRLEKLESGTAAQWGKMNAHQMVCHLLDSFRAVSGERFVSQNINWFSRHVMRRVALYAPFPWPKGIPTRPEIAQDGSGTAPAEWASDLSTLLERLRAFPEQTRFDPHPMFGEMELAEWRIWAYRHCDHHFRQFGI